MPFSEWPAHLKAGAIVTLTVAGLAVYFAADWFMHALPTGLVWPFVGVMMAFALACGIVGYAPAYREWRQRRNRNRL